MKRPRLIKDIDLSRLKVMLEEHLDELDTNEFADEDTPHFVYETVLESFYGKNIWDWVNGDRK